VNLRRPALYVHFSQSDATVGLTEATEDRILPSWGSGMEFIRVHFDLHDIRDVLANGNVVGETESELTLPPNFYVITLSGSGYSPASWSGAVSGTTPNHPLSIRFTRL
jgi:hypothetical protein